MSFRRRLGLNKNGLHRGFDSFLPPKPAEEATMWAGSLGNLQNIKVRFSMGIPIHFAGVSIVFRPGDFYIIRQYCFPINVGRFYLFTSKVFCPVQIRPAEVRHAKASFAEVCHI